MQRVVVNIDFLAIVSDRGAIVVPDWSVVPGVLQVAGAIRAAKDVTCLFVAHPAIFDCRRVNRGSDFLV